MGFPSILILGCIVIPLNKSALNLEGGSWGAYPGPDADRTRPRGPQLSMRLLSRSEQNPRQSLARYRGGEGLLVLTERAVPTGSHAL
jgi:hypothetical protein